MTSPWTVHNVRRYVREMAKWLWAFPRKTELLIIVAVAAVTVLLLLT